MARPQSTGRKEAISFNDGLGWKTGGYCRVRKYRQAGGEGVCGDGRGGGGLYGQSEDE